MKNATALYCLDVATPDDVIRTAAETAAKQNTHLALLLYSEFPTLPLSTFSALPYGSISVPHAWPENLKAAQTKLENRIEAVQRLLGQENAPADIRPLFVAEADIKDKVAQACRSCDVAYFAPDLRYNDVVFRELLHSVLFHSPILAIVNGSLEGCYKRALLAWNDSLSCARAAHLALPFLKEAEHVHIACFDMPATAVGRGIEPGREVSVWLSHHGCDVTLTQLPTGGREVGACILDHAGEIGADLVVAGAYGHSRLQQAVFGGTSRTLIEQCKTPVFMAH